MYSHHTLGPGSQYVLVAPCGCPLGVREGYTAATVDDARYLLADGNRRTLLDWHRRGVAVVHVTASTYEQVYVPKMRHGCTHRGQS